MTEQDFKDKFSSIMYKAIKLESDNPENAGVLIVVRIAVGAAISIYLTTGYNANITLDIKRFILRLGLKVDIDYTGNTQHTSRNINYITPDEVYQRLSRIENGLDSVDHAIILAKEIDREFTQKGWGKNWE